MSTHPLALNLTDCRNRHKTGATTPETSRYSPLESLPNAVAAKLKPKVLCFMNLKDQGAGMPDGGLFTKDQIARGTDEPPPGQVPATNYREFLLIGRDDMGRGVRHEYYRLAESEKEFWQLTQSPDKAAEIHGERLLDFFRRCLFRLAPLTDPKDVSGCTFARMRGIRGKG